ncbi:class III poly(R)-hydroxyalkanoic acid synthase subunit PhaC [Rhizobium leguminosarum]|uniref:class III poly(R)-hydroxyalkanoic acid synthase subunit PhaC n=1 Tax=Rhizobium leguminosarum TaxID=384 RepID=UPI00143F0769|nr:class III poly(R)-hydroxyalkanoic acid synthase subunit PhaC [Rhizobium leguminosarum]MBY5840984.1 class III poly(R)-hydroxyalkanoic acid synthase subunit PhaC [Rhizobium leguminosarum]NKM65529.1 class III poly(R)-hydroxyalkanoic acid synthase subunit PhaC [Rhizobium leguminosarum bv. viciae]NKM81092.1 class III poly(R)-hydroxyalkanoic acid synthase subunit PhaC [Rhizobium leguminosarum bv. viciae]QSZ07334.1 class III poly(R)-hydroxyalkanoic acid synthase subunit PhaC [Rhizobium leguminosaru
MTEPRETAFTSFLKDFAENVGKFHKGANVLAGIRDEDVDVGATPKTLVMRRDKVGLFRYEPTAKRTVETPVLIVYSLVGRYTIADLQSDRSLVRSLLAEGTDLWLIDWGKPGRTERWLMMDDYVDDYIHQAVHRICRETGHDKVTLLGICQGGVFATCYAALHPEKVKNLILTITPIDFHADIDDPAAIQGLLNIWIRSLAPEDIDRMVDALGGVIPGEFMSSIFSLMRPMHSLTKYNVGLFDIVDDKDRLMNFLRMEKWLADRPDHPGEAGRRWLKELYQENRLAEGRFELSGRIVDLRAIDMPVLNIYARDDHIIPPSCSRALGGKIGSADYKEVPLPCGHVGLFVSSKTQDKLIKIIPEWLRARDG